MAAALLRLFVLPLAVSALATPSQLYRRTGLTPHDVGSQVDLTSDIGSYPRANYLQDGCIIGTFVETDGANTTIKTIKSSDNGHSWHGNYTVYTNFTSTNWIDNPYPLQLPSGRVLLIVRNHYRQPFSNFLEYRFTMFASDDNGDTFYYVNEAVTKLPSAVPNTGGQGIYEPFMRIAQDGSTIQLYYSEEDNPTGDADQNSMMRTSTDGGQTWSNPPKQISGEGITTRDGMLGVVNTGGSKLIAVFEVFGDSALVGGGSTVGSVFSPDDGVTWGNRTDVYVPATDRSAGSPQVIQVGTTTVVSFMNSNGVAGGGLIGYNGTAATIRTSSDGGHTWGTPFDVISTGANEPGLLTLRHTHTHNSSFALMTAIEQQAQTTLDGILVSQRVNLS